jgi:hypothetical protein
VISDSNPVIANMIITRGLHDFNIFFSLDHATAKANRINKLRYARWEVMPEPSLTRKEIVLSMLGADPRTEVCYISITLLF